MLLGGASVVSGLRRRLRAGDTLQVSLLGGFRFRDPGRHGLSPGRLGLGPATRIRLRDVRLGATLFRSA